MACFTAHNVISFQVNTCTTCPNWEGDGNNEINANKRQGAWFGHLHAFYTDPLHIKDTRSTGIDATNSSSVHLVERLTPRDDCH
jgi:hypothetical protein